MAIKYSVNIKPERRKDKEGNLIVDNVPLLIDLTFNSQRLWLNVGHRVNILKWDDQKQRAVSNTTHPKATAKEINDTIDLRKTQLNRIFDDYKHVVPTKEDIKQAYAIAVGRIADKEEKTTIQEAYAAYIKKRSPKWQPNTRKKHITVLNHLTDFNPSLALSDINRHTLDSFVNYLLNHEKNYKNSTIEQHYETLKALLLWCNRQDGKYYVDNDFQKYEFELKKGNSAVIHLDWNEFLHLYRFQPDKEYLERVKDVFCFCCMVGCRFSDVETLTKANLKDGCVIFTTKKTDHVISVPLNKYSKAILSKYEDLNLKGDRLLPVISNQKYNDYLKILAEQAGFSQKVKISHRKGNEVVTLEVPKYTLITSHVARKTFICLSLELKIPTVTIMSMSGHVDHRTMRPYINVVNKSKDEAMNLFNEIE